MKAIASQIPQSSDNGSKGILIETIVNLNVHSRIKHKFQGLWLGRCFSGGYFHGGDFNKGRFMFNFGESFFPVCKSRRFQVVLSAIFNLWKPTAAPAFYMICPLCSSLLVDFFSIHEFCWSPLFCWDHLWHSAHGFKRWGCFSAYFCFVLHSLT